MDHLVPGVMFFLTIAYIRSLPITNSPLDKKVSYIGNIDFPINTPLTFGSFDVKGEHVPDMYGKIYTIDR